MWRHVSRRTECVESKSYFILGELPGSLIAMDVFDLIDAYQSDDPTFDQQAKDAGCIMMLVSLVSNHGLMGAIDTFRLGIPQALVDVPVALRRFELAEFVELFEHAHTEYMRMLPAIEPEWELSEQDEQLWDELDEKWWAMDEDAVLEATCASRVPFHIHTVEDE